MCASPAFAYIFTSLSNINTIRLAGWKEEVVPIPLKMGDLKLPPGAGLETKPTTRASCDLQSFISLVSVVVEERAKASFGLAGWGVNLRLKYLGGIERESTS